jgi:hypothetical protein
MEKLSEVATKSPAYSKIASHAFPEGTVAKCLVCGKGRNVTTGEIANWMRKGLPKHCGQYVELMNPWKKR